jgi:2-methylcitrate dehydratase PrpD
MKATAGSTAELVTWTSDFSVSRADDRVVNAARRSVIDVVGVIVAGAGEFVTRAAASLAAEEGGVPLSVQVGGTQRLSAASTAFVNGVAAHALDYDDVSISAGGHASAVVFPSALAAALMASADGMRLVEGYVAGIEIMARLGHALGPAHYRAGWHSTAVLGVPAAALAAGKILNLDRQQLSSALGLAVSMSSGSRANFGTMAKPFVSGHAARCGLEAARLAGRGVTANAEVLESPFGFFALFGDGSRAHPAFDRLGDPLEVVEPGLALKRYPCCHAAHRAIDGALELARALGTSAHEPTTSIRRVRVIVPEGGTAPLIDRTPTSGLEAKFSMPYVVAAALLDGKVSLDTFQDESVRRPEVTGLMPLVEVREDAAIASGFNPMDGGYVTVEVWLEDGRHGEQTVVHAIGSPRQPMTGAQVSEKFMECCRPKLGVQRSAAALRLLDQLEAITDLGRDLVPSLEGNESP